MFKEPHHININNFTRVLASRSVCGCENAAAYRVFGSSGATPSHRHSTIHTTIARNNNNINNEASKTKLFKFMCCKIVCYHAGNGVRGRGGVLSERQGGIGDAGAPPQRRGVNTYRARIERAYNVCVCVRRAVAQ